MQGKKRMSKRSSSIIKKSFAKPEVPEVPELKESGDRKDAVMRDLLYTFLQLCTTKCDIHKHFAKLVFTNSNTYCGWLGPNGFQGFGTYEYDGGASYRGNFDKSLTTHIGTFVYENGNTYEGGFLGGKRHGHGLYKAKRFHYHGQFKNGSFHGEGIWKSKKQEQKGYFEDGILKKGEVTDANGVYKGIFDESALRKYGTYTFRNGNTYKGHWMDDLYFGYGIYNWIAEPTPYTLAETKYTGYWSQGERYALGILTFRRRYIISQWWSGKKSGAGVVISANGNCYAGVKMFDDKSYREGHKIRHCPESQAIIKDIMKLLQPTITYDMEEKSDRLMELVKRLVADHSEWLSPVNPIRIPNYELGHVVPDICDNELEASCLQQVLSENCNEFRQLYVDYNHPSDEYLNPLSMNLLYMDIFQRVRDVNVVECMQNSYQSISKLHSCFEDVTNMTAMSPIPFYIFFEHIVCITKVLMENEELRLTVERIRPTYFGTLAMQVIVVLRMMKTTPKPHFLVRQALVTSRPAVMSLIQSIENHSLGDKSIRAAYRFLKLIGVVDGRSLNFIKAVETYYDNVFKDGHLWETEFPLSNLELVEIVLFTCQLKLENRERALARQRKKQAANTVVCK